MPPGEAAPPLLARIRAEILERGPVTFARFMELALYDPLAGYYAGGPGRLGPRGDFFTASDLGPHFGRAIARQLLEVDRAFGPFDPLHLLEFGAGRGLLARDVVEALRVEEPEAAARLRPVLVERSAAMRDAARRNLPEARVIAPEAIEERHQGLALAVELFDALPVHRVRRVGGRLVEICVDVGPDGGLVECERPPLDEVARLAERYGAAAEEGSEAELAPSAFAELERMARALARGVLLIVDYGDRAGRLYSLRPRGTLLAYRGHRTSQGYLDHVGQQDLTAHVNFSMLEDHARGLGLAPLGLTTQDRFLVANGLLTAFEGQERAAERNDPRRVRSRLQALQLLHPAGMGRAFKVLALARGESDGRVLAGLTDPFARG